MSFYRFSYVWNWYTFLNSDVIAYADQKNFMNKTLADARTNNEKVTFRKYDEYIEALMTMKVPILKTLHDT